MSLIDTMGPANAWLGGRQQALQQQAMQQREAEAARQQQNQQRAFDLRRMEQEADNAKMQLQQRAAAVRAQILREDILSKLPQPQMAQGMGPAQNPATGGIPMVQDDWGKLREMVMNTDDPKALEDLSEIAGSRTELDALRKNWDEIKRRAGTADPSKSIGRIAMAIEAADNAGNIKRMQQLMDEYGKAEAEIEAQHQKKVKEDAQIELLANDMAVQFGIPIEEARRRVRLTKGNVINEGQNQTARTRMLSEAAIQGSTEYKRAKLGLDRIQRHIDEIETSMADTSLNPSGRKLLAQMLNAAKQQERQAEDAIIEIYARQRGEMGGGKSAQPSGYGLPQTTSTTSAPAAPMQAAPVVDDATVAQVIKALTAQLGREPTDDEIDAAMEGV